MQIELTASDGHTFSAYRADPATTPRGGIVVIQEIFGVNHHIRAVTDGLARDGYLAIAPAMFDRLQRGVELAYIPTDIAIGKELAPRIPLDGAMADVAAAVAVAATAGKVGIVGYCWGGYITWMASAQVAGLACAVPYYGGRIVDYAGIAPGCPLQGHYAERDKMIPADRVRELAAQLRTHEIHLYAADHGFACDERGSYDAPAAKLARERTIAFFRRHVG